MGSWPALPRRPSLFLATGCKGDCAARSGRMTRTLECQLGAVSTEQYSPLRRRCTPSALHLENVRVGPLFLQASRYSRNHHERFLNGVQLECSGAATANIAPC